MSKKSAKYERLYNQLKPLLINSPSLWSQMATINAVLYHKRSDFFWVGFYYLSNQELIVGPYQGPLACQTLAHAKGVCWKSILDKSPQIVKDVEAFPDHIACDSRSKSELVIPIFNSTQKIVSVIDIDSDQLELFDEEDAEGVTKILSLLNQDFIDNIS